VGPTGVSVSNRRDFVVLVFDRQFRASSEPGGADAAVLRRKPETSHLRVLLHYLRVLGPERRVLSRLGLQSDDREIDRIDPDAATIKKLVSGARLDCEDVSRVLTYRGWSVVSRLSDLLPSCFRSPELSQLI
jgi:hypothetical protein